MGFSGLSTRNSYHCCTCAFGRPWVWQGLQQRSGSRVRRSRTRSASAFQQTALQALVYPCIITPTSILALSVKPGGCCLHFTLRAEPSTAISHPNSPEMRERHCLTNMETRTSSCCTESRFYSARPIQSKLRSSTRRGKNASQAVTVECPGPRYGRAATRSGISYCSSPVSDPVAARVYQARSMVFLARAIEVSFAIPSHLGRSPTTLF